jgi:TatD DNase family protein
MFIDTHTHLYDDRLNDSKQDEMIQRAFDAGVETLYMPNCDQHTIPGMMRIAESFAGRCIPMMGLHPVYVKDDYQEELAIIEDWLKKQSFAAVGEIGLDYYWDKAHIAQQKIAFEQQIDWALEHNLPIVIHSRESTADCIDIVRSKQQGKLKGIFHCFSGGMEEAQQIIDLGFVLGIGGVVTYKNSKELQQVVKNVPLESFVLETDAPYLPPTPFRGKRNESSYLTFIAEKIAEIREISMEEVGTATTATARKVFAR